ncbi:MAG: ergothioneine biosynthesis protein EgtB [Solirubrobacterales bacterium]|nr:ergothioneine biosynthesis protein EgtB [Solirubrobacterales bacterium]
MTSGTTEPRDVTPGLGEACEALSEARERTNKLIEPLSTDQLQTVHSPLMSPLVWDLGHIAAFEDLWVSRTFERSMVRPELMAVYDADETPRANRGSLPMLDLDGALAYQEAVRAQTLELLDSVWETPERRPAALTSDRLELIVRHEHQHNETMLQTAQLAHLPGPFRPTPANTAANNAVTGLDLIDIPGGTARIGAPEGRFAYDNERGRHEVELRPFQIGRSPVTNGDWQDFIATGGYRNNELWSEAGWAWRREEDVQRPLHWSDDHHHWVLDRLEPIDRDAPVVHVSFFEAEAFAKFHQKRLPSEQEWEWAATCDPAGRQRSNPWGAEPVSADLANVDQAAGRPLPAGSYPNGVSASGLNALIGDVWEWTASEFRGYPGFKPFPYREYSEQFFGPNYRVLRGGSWAARARTVNTTFRNWDLPQRRQIFSGLRLAADAK